MSGTIMWSTPSDVERRGATRYQCQGSAEILPTPDSPVQHWAIATDLSRTGCYLETAAPLPAGQSTFVRLTMFDRKLILQARVTVVHPMFGMGMEFISMDPGTAAALDAVLALLAGTADPSVPVAALPAERKYRITGELAVSLLGQISRYLAQKGVLTQAEFINLLESQGK